MALLEEQLREERRANNEQRRISAALVVRIPEDPEGSSSEARPTELLQAPTDESSAEPRSSLLTWLRGIFS